MRDLDPYDPDEYATELEAEIKQLRAEVEHIKTRKQHYCDELNKWRSRAIAHRDNAKHLAEEVERLTKELGYSDWAAEISEANAKKERDYLVELIVKAAKWPKGCESYAHAIGHIENVISNLRCDAKTEKVLREAAEQKAERYFKLLEKALSRLDTWSDLHFEINQALKED